jgi:hypothetical protein
MGEQAKCSQKPGNELEGGLRPEVPEVGSAWRLPTAIGNPQTNAICSNANNLSKKVRPKSTRIFHPLTPAEETYYGLH